MRDGQTRKLARKSGAVGIEEFLKSYRARVVLVSGPEAGTEFVCKKKRTTLGRGPGVDWVISDASLSRQHAALEYVDGRFRIQDLGSTNGVFVGGRAVQVSELVHGERFEVGEQQLQLVIELLDETPDVFEISLEY